MIMANSFPRLPLVGFRFTILDSTQIFTYILLALLSTDLQNAKGEFHCPHGWHINNDLCYYVSKEQVTWHQARDLCQHFNATLVSIKNEAQNTFVDSIVSVTVWIGLHDYTEDDNFTWLDNTPVNNYTKWAPGEPNNAGENCVSLYAHYNKGSWNDVVCRKKNKFICQRTVNLSGACADGWSQMLASCILVSTTPATWYDARQQCQALGGDLVIIKNQTENDLIKSVMPNSDVWVGLSDLSTEGLFAWLDDTSEASYFNWHSGEPNNGNNVLEDCVNMVTTYNRKGQWATDGCQERYWFACEVVAVSTSNNTNITNCPVGWTQYNNSCYLLPQHLVTWSEGRHVCKELGGDLVVIETEDEQKFLSGHQNFTTTKVWIGLSDLRERDTWSWLDNQEKVSGFSNWGRLEPSNSSPRSDCVMLHMTSHNLGHWEPARCMRTLGYICETHAAGYCAVGWMLYNGHCYYINATEVTWLEAETLCNNMTSQGHLISIDDNNEQQYIEGLLKEHQGKKGFWIGLNSLRKANVFVWTNHQQPTWTNWDIGPPKNVTDEKCVERVGKGIGKGQWNDNNCMDDRAFVCQRPAGGEETFFDFAQNNSVYKVVWHQMPQTEGDAFCQRHLGSNASMWRVDDFEELQQVGAKLFPRVQGTGQQFWVSGDPTVEGTFVHYSSSQQNPQPGPGRRCLMVSQERSYWGDYGYRYYWTPPPTATPSYIMTPRPCCEEKMVICEKNLGPGSEKVFGNLENMSLYRLVTERNLPYVEADAACQQMLGSGAGLAVVDTKEEQLLLSAEVKARHRGAFVTYWLGGHPEVDVTKKQAGLLLRKAREGENCEVLHHENIAEVKWDDVIFDIVPADCMGAKPFICELQLSPSVAVGGEDAGSSSTISSSVIEESVSQPNRIHMALVSVGCTGPCIGLAIAYPFTVLATILITVCVIHYCKRSPARYRNVKSSTLELGVVKNGKHMSPQEIDSLTALTEGEDFG